MFSYSKSFLDFISLEIINYLPKRKKHHTQEQIQIVRHQRTCIALSMLLRWPLENQEGIIIQSNNKLEKHLHFLHWETVILENWNCGLLAYKSYIS